MKNRALLLALLLPLLLPTRAALATAVPTDDPYAGVGEQVTGRMEDGVAITEGVIRVRRRHENDMDFSKYNPFYWQGRRAWFEVRDYTPKGEDRITFTLRTEWPQSYNKLRGSDLSAIYKGDPLANETLRSKFAINSRMKHIDGFTHFEAELDKTSFHQRPDELAKGKLLTFEFRFFNDEEFEGWAKQKKRNPHNLFAYYSEFFRIQIGKPGLLIDNFEGKKSPPSPRRYSGGWTTIPTVRVEPWSALQQQAFNLRPSHSQDFLTGRSWFHTDMVNGKHRSDPSDDKPSMFFEDMEAARSGMAASFYNARTCNACHVHNASAPLPKTGDPIHTTVLRLPDRTTGKPHGSLGIQLQTDGDDKEGVARISRYETKKETLADGTVVELSKPVYEITSETDTTSIAISPRHPPAIIGTGLLEAVSDETIKANAATSKGIAHKTGNGIGRFGWKAEQPTVAAQIRDALRNDMGVISKGFETLDNASAGTKGKAPLDEQAIAELEAYVALLAVPPRNRPENAQVLRGEQVFRKLNCQQCHTPKLRTGASKFEELANQTIHPFTDLLLHDMGDALSDPGTHKMARLWRTAPLWALKNKRDAADDQVEKFRSGEIEVTYQQTHAAAANNPIRLLHDGRARTLAEAILWHGGEAKPSVDLYKKSSAEDRSDLEAFLWDL